MQQLLSQLDGLIRGEYTSQENLREARIALQARQLALGVLLLGAFYGLCMGLFGLGACCGQLTLATHYRPLVARDRRHLAALVAWFVLYVFVTIKVAWVLRPLVGDPQLTTTFVRADAWQENPYTNLFWTVVAFLWKAAHVIGG